MIDVRKSKGYRGQRARANLAAMQESTIDRLAEALEGDFDVATPGWSGPTLKEAAAQIGISYDFANALLQRMRKRLGERAR